MSDVLTNEIFNVAPAGPAGYAEIIIPLALPTTYTYAIPAPLKEKIQPGVRVEVIFGKQKRYAGIVKRVFDEKPKAFEPKDIQNILDAEPVVYETQLRLWNWIAHYYMCSEGEVMAAALPSHFKLSSETILVFNEEYGDNFSALDHNEYLVAEALLIKKQLNLSEVQQVLDAANTYPVVKKLIDKKVCFVWESLKEKYTPRIENFIRLHPQYSQEEKLAALLNQWKKAPKQLELLLAWLHLSKTEGEVKQTELLKKSGATAAQLKGLADKNILIIEKLFVDRIKYLPKEVNIDFTLSDAQTESLQKINEVFADKQVCLLHGITSSGKTQVYIRLIEQYIKEGKQVLYLLPEIALTSQIIRRLQKHFGGYIAIYHSKFSQNERIEIWNKVKNAEIRIVLGARSSLFLPFTNPGLIIVDEEHDASFKQQDPAPRYHARDTAIYYASQFGAKVLLGSATPSMESYYNAASGKYTLVELNERFGGVELPEIEITDTRQVVKKDKSRVIISPQLHEAINQTLEKNKQVILFQNRRGYSPYLICGTCGFIPHCNNCDVTLTYHKVFHKLQCHYCGTTYPKLISCPACGTTKWLERNFGTERIEEELQEQFPKARISRMDIDTVKGKTAHDTLIQQFEQQRTDILVGTQMVVKGLDFDHVNLVGVLDADGLLGFADFRVNERAFQLMEQVSGRAGRKNDRGKVIIQTTNPKHPLLELVQQHDYKKFYEFELKGRQHFFYPPYSRIILLTFKHKIKDTADSAANFMANALAKEFGKYIVGPAEPVVGRVRNLYLVELLLKLPKDSKLIDYAKHVILQQSAILQHDKKFRSVVMLPDVDPV
ncbi:MAG: primosomal protein N' [Chitinophagaceae bacterium]|nr:primosomal protein N' [Chitinophagaceae bacterium]